MTDYENELQKHIAFMGKIQHNMEALFLVLPAMGSVVEQFKEAMRFLIDHIEAQK